MTSAWPSAEAAIHRWIRESTGLSGTSCFWPTHEKTKPDPPCCEMKLTGGRQTGAAGARGGKKTAQIVEWLVTLTAAVGTHGIQIWTDSGSAPTVDIEVIVVDDDPSPTIADARDALLAALNLALPLGITATASGTTGIALAGVTTDDVFTLGATDLITLTIVASPFSSTRITQVVIILMLVFRATPTSGLGTARELANKARNGIGDYRRLIRRAGWSVGACVGDRPGYDDNVIESNAVLEFELLGYEADYAIPRPWVRRGPATTATASGLTATITTP